MTKLYDYVKIAEAEQLLSVSQNMLRLWTDAGKVKVHRNPANGYRLFKRSKVVAFLLRVAKADKAHLDCRDSLGAS
jgi:DNA-binding transcriptional MerR regulator